jgi:hypothetical protein
VQSAAEQQSPAWQAPEQHLPPGHWPSTVQFAQVPPLQTWPLWQSSVLQQFPGAQLSTQQVWTGPHSSQLVQSRQVRVAGSHTLVPPEQSAFEQQSTARHWPEQHSSSVGHSLLCWQAWHTDPMQAWWVAAQSAAEQQLPTWHERLQQTSLG